MKKVLKNKKALLAVLAVAVVACMIWAGTYAWFIQNAGGDRTAILEAAYFKLDADIGDPEPGHIIHTNDFVFEPCVADLDIAYDFTNGYYLYPGDALKWTNIVTLEHNREVLIKVDFTEFWGIGEGALDPDFAGDTTFEDVIDDLLAEFVSNDDTVVFADPDNLGVYYLFVKADDGAAEITFDSIFGIKGQPYNQNYFMNAKFTVNIEPDVTAVQATEQAITDIFGISYNDGSAVAAWLFGLPEFAEYIHDAGTAVNYDAALAAFEAALARWSSIWPNSANYGNYSDVNSELQTTGGIFWAKINSGNNDYLTADTATLISATTAANATMDKLETLKIEAISTNWDGAGRFYFGFTALEELDFSAGDLGVNVYVEYSLDNIDFTRETTFKTWTWNIFASIYNDIDSSHKYGATGTVPAGEEAWTTIHCNEGTPAGSRFPGFYNAIQTEDNVYVRPVVEVLKNGNVIQTVTFDSVSVGRIR